MTAEVTLEELLTKSPVVLDYGYDPVARLTSAASSKTVTVGHDAFTFNAFTTVTQDEYGVIKGQSRVDKSRSWTLTAGIDG